MQTMGMEFAVLRVKGILNKDARNCPGYEAIRGYGDDFLRFDQGGYCFNLTRE